MSDAVERRIVAMLDGPLVCPHGNPIPGLEDLGVPTAGSADTTVLPTLAASVAAAEEVTVRIERISELLQPNVELMRQLSDSGMTPGLSVAVSRVPDGLHVAGAPETELVLDEVARHIFVSVPA